MDKQTLSRKIKMKALELGFAKVGFAPAEDMTEYIEEFGRTGRKRAWMDKKRI